MGNAGDAYFLHGLLLLGSILATIGCVGFVIRRNQIHSSLSAAILFQGAILVAAGFSVFHQSWSGQLLALLALPVSSSQIVLVLAVYHRRSE